MTNPETSDAPRNTEKQLVGRAVCPTVGDRFEKLAASTVTVTAVHANGSVSLQYHGQLEESDYWVCRSDYKRLVRKMLEQGATFHPANDQADPQKRSEV